ncbi:MAG: phytanoyl-CoA dioxygenase family protein [Myxococcales bacterium]|nr:phytanoyl-CoA dioxygenase family protein [Myxococcales bacterium]
MAIAFPQPSEPSRWLADDEIAAYQRDGVICARGLLDLAWIERLRTALEHAIAEENVLSKNLAAGKGFHGDIFVWKLNDEFRDLALFSPLPRLANQILRSERVNFFYEQFFVKRAGSPVETPWHQDIPFWPVAGDQIVSFWITLDPVTRESSGLEFVRGSHRWTRRYKAVTPSYDPYMMDTDLPTAPDFSKLRDEHDVVGWDMEPGDVLVFGPTVCHGSDANLSNERDRRALAFRYAGDDVTFAPRHATMPLLWDHGLEPGDRLGGSLFPQVLPSVIEEEIATRWQGPEPPSPRALQAFLQHLSETGFGPGGEKRSLFDAALTDDA